MAARVALWSDEVEDSQLRTLALDVLQELGSVSNTGKGFVVGGREDLQALPRGAPDVVGPDRIYSTAMACLILEIYNHFLPAYQR